MSYKEITNISISLQTTPVSRQGFGTSIFISDHFWFTDRVRGYTSLDAVAEDFPSDSDAYLAAQAAFSQYDDRPAIVKLARRQADSITFTPDAVTGIGEVYQLAVKGTDGVTVTSTFTTITGSETPAEVVTAVAGGLSGVVGVTVTNNGDTFDLTKSGTADFAVSPVMTGLSYSTVATESAADVLEAITVEDDDYYFIACNDHTDAFVMSMAAAVEARSKLYFVALQDVANLGVYSDVATDTMSKLKQNAYYRTSAWYHHEADTKFPEMQYINIAAPSDAGAKIWANNRVTGFPVSRNVSTGKLLSTTEKTNIIAKKANFTESVGDTVITRYGFVSAGEKINIIRNRDFLEARLTENYNMFLINKPVVPYTNEGITASKNVCESTLSRYVSKSGTPSILESYTISFPRRENVDPLDVANGELTGSFVGYLAGAILITNINGSLTYNTEII